MYRQVWESAVGVLGQAVRLTRSGPGWSCEPIDFGDFLASCLASVAANVGSVGRLTAGRPGSWEADLVSQLLRGTVGYTDDDLLRHRTEPVIVPLNVPCLTWGGVTNVHSALDAIRQRRGALPGEDFDDEELTEELALEAARFEKEFRKYAAAFAGEVRRAADQIAELSVPVEVHAITDVDGALADVTPQNSAPWPDDLEYDPMVWRLWWAAYTTVPPVILPGASPDAPGSPPDIEGTAKAMVGCVGLEAGSGP